MSLWQQANEPSTPNQALHLPQSAYRLYATQVPIARRLKAFSNIESDRVERKVSLSDTSKVRQAICAFANDLPNYRQAGVVFVDVNGVNITGLVQT